MLRACSRWPVSYAGRPVSASLLPSGKRHEQLPAAQLKLSRGREKSSTVQSSTNHSGVTSACARYPGPASGTIRIECAAVVPAAVDQATASHLVPTCTHCNFSHLRKEQPFTTPTALGPPHASHLRGAYGFAQGTTTGAGSFLFCATPSRAPKLSQNCHQVPTAIPNLRYLASLSIELIVAGQSRLIKLVCTLLLKTMPKHHRRVAHASVQGPNQPTPLLRHHAYCDIQWGSAITYVK